MVKATPAGTGPNHGRSWRPLWTGTETRDYALSEYEVDAIRGTVDMDLMTVHSTRYRMSTDLGTETGELHNFQEDPDGKMNLFDDPGYGDMRREHLDMIRARPADQIPVSPRVGWH